MSTRRLRAPAVLAALGFLAAVLVLNLGEQDVYPGGSAQARRAFLPENPFLPERIAHACPTCGECTHPLEVLENRRDLRVADRDGWYRLFWAGDDVYHFEDPVLMAASLRNPTAGAPEGVWTVRAEVGPSTHGPVANHACSVTAKEIALEYELVASEERIEERPLPSEGGFKPWEVVPWMASRDPALHFGWRLSAPARVPVGPCRCSRP